MQVNGVCIAWWYLTCGAGNAHCFVAVFVHHHRNDLFVELAEGKSSMYGFPKDDHITKPTWSFDETSPTSRRKVLALVLKYAVSIVEARKDRGFELSHRSFNEDTGSHNDGVMLAWERTHSQVQNLTLRGTPHPQWWPTTKTVNTMNMDIEARRQTFHEDGFDIKWHLNQAMSPKKRKKGKPVYRRVGRFLVFAKD